MRFSPKVTAHFLLLLSLSLVVSSCGYRREALLYKELRAVMAGDDEKKKEEFFDSLSKEKLPFRIDLLFNYGVSLIPVKGQSAPAGQDSDGEKEAALAKENLLQAKALFERIVVLDPAHEKAARNLEYLRRLEGEQKRQKGLQQALDEMKEQQEQANSAEDQQSLEKKAQQWQDKAAQSGSQETRENAQQMKEIQEKMKEAAGQKSAGNEEAFDQKKKDILQDLQQLQQKRGEDGKSSSASGKAGEGEPQKAETRKQSARKQEADDIMKQEQQNPETESQDNTGQPQGEYRNW